MGANMKRAQFWREPMTEIIVAEAVPSGVCGGGHSGENMSCVVSGIGRKCQDVGCKSIAFTVVRKLNCPKAYDATTAP